MTRPGNGYALRVVGEGGPVKIGFTAGKPIVRARSLEMASPYNLEWFAAWKTTREEDTEVLRRFREYAMPGKREWFRPVAPVLAYISEKCPSFSREKSIKAETFHEDRSNLRAIVADVTKRKRIRARACLMNEIINLHGCDKDDLWGWIEGGRPPKEQTVEAVRNFMMTNGDLARHVANGWRQ